jgi:hypothetical protein
MFVRLIKVSSTEFPFRIAEVRFPELSKGITSHPVSQQPGMIHRLNKQSTPTTGRKIPIHCISIPEKYREGNQFIILFARFDRIACH